MALINRKKNQDILAVEVTANTLKVLNLAKQGTKFKVSGLGISKLEENIVSNGRIINKDEFNSCLDAIASSHKLNGKSAVYSLTSNQVSFKTDFFAPEIPDKELEKQITQNLGRFTSTSLKDAALDFRRTGQKKADKVEIGVYVAKNEFLNDRSQYLERVGLTPKVVTTVAAAVEEFVRVFGIGHNNGEAFAIFNFDSAQSTLFILKGNKVVKQSSSDIGTNRLLSDIRSYFPNEEINSLQDIQYSDAVLEKYEETLLPQFLKSVCDDISREIALYQTGLSASDVTDIFLAGEINVFPEFITAAKSEFSAIVQPIRYLDKEILTFTNTKEKDIFVLKEQELFLLVATSLAGFNDNLPNVLPWRIELAEANKKDYKIKAFIAAMIGGALVYGFMQYGNSLAAKQIAADELIIQKATAIDAELLKQKDVQEKNRLMQQKIDLIESLQTNRTETVRIANSISASTPMSVVLTKVKREGENLIITGLAVNTDQVILLMRNLKDTKIYENIFMSSFVTPESDESITPNAALTPERGSIPEDQYSTFSLTMKINIHSKTGIESASPITSQALPSATSQPVSQPTAVAPQQQTQNVQLQAAAQSSQPIAPQAAIPQPSQSNTDSTPNQKQMVGQFNGVQ